MSDTPVESAARTASVLAIDAGNSKTDVAIIAGDGSVLADARGPGFQPPAVGVAAAFDMLASTVDEALAKGRAQGAVIDGVDHVSACLANADLPVEERELTAALHARGWGRTAEVRNDTFAILRAGIDEPRGVAVVCGAGMNCVGLLPDGRTARFPAIGKISGDWGGGAGLAEEALWFAARAEDGRGAPTELARTLPAHFGLNSVYALIEALHLGHIASARKHELTPVLFATSAQGDHVARSLILRLAKEVVAMSTVALAKLGLLQEEAPVLLGGSVLAARHRALDEHITRLLAKKAPNAVIEVVTAPPVLGAGLLGLDHVGASAEARATLRAHYTRPRG
ncbi:BadF/BadG/BcrA/BcrD ATPase family protein [Streptomyces sp. NPDC050625]|uniref:N-acetylglucosamine kinase n=1 Tax=Streptomyces sp. NPDC050625 TaxID=3154629 RepID=UPI0034178FDB